MTGILFWIAVFVVSVGLSCLLLRGLQNNGAGGKASAEPSFSPLPFIASNRSRKSSDDSVSLAVLATHYSSSYDGGSSCDSSSSCGGD